jgi:hypothetical protein
MAAPQKAAKPPVKAIFGIPCGLPTSRMERRQKKSEIVESSRSWAAYQ